MNTLRIAAFALLLSVCVTPQAETHPLKEAPPLLLAEPSSGPTKGRIRVEWHRTGVGLVEDYSYPGQLRVYLDGQLRQTFDDETYAPSAQLRLEMLDLSGDGQEDLLFMHGHNGVSQEFSLVYLWVPAQQKFVTSETLSDRGELEIGKTPGCVSVVNFCHGRTSFVEERFCFNQRTGRWRPGKMDRNNCEL
jgi:hypothetical protein